jgi:hypothetical protein
MRRCREEDFSRTQLALPGEAWRCKSCVEDESVAIRLGGANEL